MPFTNLTNLEEIDVYLPPEIIRHYTKLKKIELQTIEYAQQLDLTRFSSLEFVNWLFSSYDESPTLDPLLIIPHTRHVTILMIENGLPHSIINGDYLTRYSNLKVFKLYDHDGTQIVNMPYLPNLEILQLRTSKIGSLSTLHETLTSLKLTCFDSDSDSLAALTKLRHLDIFWRKTHTLRDVYFLTALTNLETISFRSPYGREERADWSDTFPLISTTKLTSLHVHGDCRLDSAIRFASTLKDLVVKTIQPVNYLGSFTNLTSLKIDSLTSEMLPIIEELTQLKKLDLTVGFTDDVAGITAKDILIIDNFTRLEELSFSDSYYFQPHIIYDRIHFLPLKKLHLSWVDNDFLAHIANIPTLEYLWIELAEDLDDTAILMLTSLSNLTTLGLQRVDHELMTGVHLTLLTTLQVLQIYSNGPSCVDNDTLEKVIPRLYYCVQNVRK